VLGTIGLLVGVLVCAWAFRRTQRGFETAYYQALAALADGELLGEISESAPGPQYLGSWFVERLPTALRPLVARDLRQAWRRNRLDHIALLVASFVFAFFALRSRATLVERGWLWPAIWLLVSAAGAQAFRLTRPSSDAPWLWLTLPVSTREQYLSRLLATFFFSLLILPALWLAAGWAGVGWGQATLVLVLTTTCGALAGVNLALVFFTRRRLAGILYVGVMGLPLIVMSHDPLLADGVLLLLAGLSLLPLRQLRQRLAAAEQAG
jgi:hypothetical protein